MNKLPDNFLDYGKPMAKPLDVIQQGHILNAYKDDRQWIAYCQVCSAESVQLDQHCPGKYVRGYFSKPVDNKSE